MLIPISLYGSCWYNTNRHTGAGENKHPGWGLIKAQFEYSAFRYAVNQMAEGLHLKMESEKQLAKDRTTKPKYYFQEIASYIYVHDSVKMEFVHVTKLDLD